MVCSSEWDYRLRQAASDPFRFGTRHGVPVRSLFPQNPCESKWSVHRKQGSPEQAFGVLDPKEIKDARTAGLAQELYCSCGLRLGHAGRIIRAWTSPWGREDFLSVDLAARRPCARGEERYREEGSLGCGSPRGPARHASPRPGAGVMAVAGDPGRSCAEIGAFRPVAGKQSGFGASIFSSGKNTGKRA